MNKEYDLAHFIAAILFKHKDGLSLKAIYKEVERWEKLPSKWNNPIPHGGAYNKLKLMGLNWKDLNSEHLQSLVDTEPQWKNEVRQVKRRLKEYGWLDDNQPRGQWCLNNKGRYEIETWLYY